MDEGGDEALFFFKVTAHRFLSFTTTTLSSLLFSSTLNSPLNHQPNTRLTIIPHNAALVLYGFASRRGFLILNRVADL
ncbi:hypothetical protein RJT34_22899 [Clitoria ternatea]|uniref:Uncharacterized protein n=1 Tax=Clitoria ternatea TaxID=43366 RepID=A0AAN9FKQ8_CLITE